MDIFRSKEVYRKVRKRDDVNSQDPIIPVRGMYVVGQYLVPEYKGSGIEITGIDTVKPRIVNFTISDQEVYPSDSIVGVYSFTVTDPTVTRYTVKEESINPNNDIVGLYSYTIGDTTLVKYGRSYHDNYEDSNVGLYSFTIKPEFNIVDYYPKTLKSQPEPMILIRDVRTNDITISDVVGRSIEEGGDTNV